MLKKRKLAKAIIVFDRNVKASELNLITNEFYGEVIITKKLIVDKDLTIECDLFVGGDVVKKSPISECEIKINGDLCCCGDIHCNDIEVSGCFFAGGIIYSKNITVGEDFVCYDKVDAYGCNIIVVGDCEVLSIKAESVKVKGLVTTYGGISAKYLKAGY